MEASLRKLRLVQFLMLGSIGLYVLISERYGPAPRASQPIFLYLMAGLAGACGVGALVVRYVIVKRQEAILIGAPENKAALRRWESAYVLVYALCEAVAVYGMVLRFTGFSFAPAVVLYMAGFLLMLFLGPQAPAAG
ncbi:MAG TPA: hypothetical protein VLV49_19295 [Terriglobales bacterium]|nr:hypothetical protein [Terriglobales bacterium]